MKFYRHLYTGFFYIALPIILLRLLWRGIKTRDYWQRISERLGFAPFKVTVPSIWLHSVSMGETLAAIPLIRALKQQYPTVPIVVTTTTSTGSLQVRQHLGDSVLHSYAPYDLPSMIARFFNQVQPKILIVMETELWPNWFFACQKTQIPIIIANARLSSKSHQGYQRILPLTQQMLACVSGVAAQTQMDAQNYIALGLPAEKVQVTGNIKFDLEMPKDMAAQIKILQTQLGHNRPIWLAASTHEGEDEQVLAAFATIRATTPNALLILIPRHPHRFEKVASLCQQQGYELVLRSENKPCQASTSILLGDTMGEVKLFCAVSDVAFIGGSLMPVGGHNLLEPAAFGVPVLCGPYIHNFTAIGSLLCQAGGARIVKNSHELAMTVLELLQDSTLRTSMGQKAYQVVVANRGALGKLLTFIEGVCDARYQEKKS